MRAARKRYGDMIVFINYIFFRPLCIVISLEMPYNNAITHKEDFPMADETKATPVTEEEADDVRVTLDLDDGTQVECRILTIFDVNKQDYIALLPLDKDGNDNADGEVFIYRYMEDEDGTPSLSNIENDEEYEAVSDRFDELLDDAMFDEMDD